MAEAVVDVRAVFSLFQPQRCPMSPHVDCFCQLGVARETTLNEPVQETILRDLRMSVRALLFLLIAGGALALGD